MSGFSMMQGKAPADLANMISDAMHDAMRIGMEADEVACVVVNVAADYARGIYGDVYLQELATVIMARATMPMPKERT